MFGRPLSQVKIPRTGITEVGLEPITSGMCEVFVRSHLLVACCSGVCFLQDYVSASLTHISLAFLTFVVEDLLS